MNANFDISTTPIVDGTYLEASAGTGKTWSIAALVAREIATRGDLSIANILITTFTRNAAAELRDRVRRRLIDTADALSRPASATDDALVTHLRAGTVSSVEDEIARLRRAVVEFDTATVSTIHSVCSRILVQAGLPSAASDAEVERRTIRETVNDFVVAEAVANRKWDSTALETTVTKALGAPDAELWIDPELEPRRRATVESVRDAVARIVETVRRKMVLTPTFDDLVRRAAEVVASDAHPEARKVIGDRYSLVLIDEAQDTDSLQWEVFEGIVVGSGGRAEMVVVGDPKQSIYRFRGADIDAYNRRRDATKLRPLGTNFRSDPALVDALNAMLGGTNYGPGIGYQHVASDPARASQPPSRVVGVAPVEIIDAEGATSAGALRHHVVSRVAAILDKVELVDEEGESRKVSENDICVLVNSNRTGSLIESGLRTRGIHAVSGGTASVMESEAARDLAAILRACERPSDPGRSRRGSATMFFGASLIDESLLDPARQDSVAEEVGDLSRVLSRSGVAAFGARLLDIAAANGNMLSSELAERRMTDLRHVVELLHAATEGKGVDATTVLEVFSDLASLEASSETVARRVESDSSAVTIMTVHAAKGLEFPVVVVADLWKMPVSREREAPLVVTLPGGTSRILDVAWAAEPEPPATSRSASSAVSSAEQSAAWAELARRFYVAVTRARHHLSVVVPVALKESEFANLVSSDFLASRPPTARIVQSEVTRGRRSRTDLPVEPGLAPFDAPTTRTFRRTSFSGITDEVKGHESSRRDFTLPGSGRDERPASDDVVVDAGVAPIPGADMPLADVPAGTDVGTAIHSIFEDLDTTATPLREEIERLVDRHASGPVLRGRRREIVDGLEKAVRTPLGDMFGGLSLADISAHDRLAELSFEMGLAHLSEDVRVSVIGRVLLDILPADDPLRPYASDLAGGAFDAVPLAGLINGSIDAVLRLEVNGATKLFITDYKSNRLAAPTGGSAIDAYAPSRLVDAMVEHHYPLQALIYGVAIHRYLRWRAPHLDSDDVIGGVAYFFLRGMVNDPAFVENGSPFGVFQWTAPRGLWSALSDSMAGVAR